MYPEQPASINSKKSPKPVFFNSWFNKPPLGCLPYMCEGGGRYDSDPKTPGWQEDSFWVGGYYGPREEIIEEKVKAAFQALPPGMHYCYDLEQYKYDGRAATDAEVEDAQRKIRRFILTAKKYRPDLRYSVYSLAPSQDYWTPNSYYDGLNYWERYRKEGIGKFSDSDRWHLSQVASNHKDFNVYEWDETLEAVVRFRAWQKSNDRLAYGVKDNGKVTSTGGVIDVLDYMSPSCYDFYVGNDTELYVKGNCLEAKRVGGSRPIYPFVWPCYHDSNAEVGGKPIPLDEWRQHIRWVMKYADGCIIWGVPEQGFEQHVWIALDEAERVVSNRY